MTRLLPILAAFAVAAPAAAATYSATPAAPVASGRTIDRGIAWHCAGATCTGATDESRPAMICERFVRTRGALTGFAVDGEAFTATELDRCNRVAKAPAPAGKLAAAR